MLQETEFFFLIEEGSGQGELFFGRSVTVALFHVRLTVMDVSRSSVLYDSSPRRLNVVWPRTVALSGQSVCLGIEARGYSILAGQ